jgi:hydroxyacylglutathione hydrolase
VEQLLVGDMQNFSYIIHSQGRSAVVDPSFGGKRILERLKELRLQLDYILSTHGHFDHNMDNDFLRARTGASVVAHESSPIVKDVSLKGGESIGVGSARIKVLYTPGHSRDSVCYILPGSVFTGDTLFVGTCGRADLPDSDPAQLFNSLRQLSDLDPSTVVYPGHDYGKSRTSTIGQEIRANPAYRPRTPEEFHDFVL